MNDDKIARRDHLLFCGAAALLLFILALMSAILI